MSIGEIEKIIREALKQAACRKEVRRISLFGSQLSGLAAKNSDVDLLVELEPQAKIGLFGLYDLEQLLAAKLKRRIDLTTPDGLDKRIRKKVLEESRPVYEK